LDKAAFTLYLIILILSPLLFGAVHTYAYTLMALGVLTGVVLLVIKNTTKGHNSGSYRFQVPKTSLNLAFFVLLAFIILQATPLPEFLVKVLSPEALIAGKKSLSASGVLASETTLRHWFSLSPYYYAVRGSLIRWIVYGLFFIGLTQALNSRKKIELAIFVILITGCFEVLYGLTQTYTGSNHIWWFKNIGDPRAISGTYINRNHFAGLMEMCLILAAGYAAALAGRRKRRGPISAYTTSLRARISRYLSGEQRFNKGTLLVFLGVVMGIGLIFSASRGGMLSGAGAMLCMGMFFIFRKAHRRKGFIILFLCVIISVYALHIGVDYPIGRFNYFDEGLEARRRYTQKTMDMFEDYRITGVGVGNFQYAYPRYQAVEDTKGFLRYAHNDWAQFLAEAGITGFCLLLTGIFYYVYRTIKFWRKRSDPFAICVGIVPLAAITALAIHSYSDFNLHIPANCLMLAAIMAIGYSALHLERHHGRDTAHNRYHIMPLKYKGIFILLLVLGLIIWTGFWTIRHFMAEAYFNTVTNSTLNRDQNPALEEITKAIEWDKWNAQYWYKLARELMRIRSKDFTDFKDKMPVGRVDDLDDWMKQFETTQLHEIGDRKKPIQRFIIRALEEAVQLNPLKAEYHLHLGWDYTFLWHNPDYHEKWLPAADLSMDRAAYFAGEHNPYLHRMMGHYWVMRSKTVHPSKPDWEMAWSKACWHYKRSLSLESGLDLKRMTNEVRKHVWAYYPDEEFVKQAIE
jgi:O-antigen ligase